MLHLERRLENEIMEVKGLEMSGSFYFEDYDKVKANFQQQSGKRLCLNYFF